MTLQEHQKNGEHIFLTGISARLAIDRAIEHLMDKTASDARSAAFEDCTKYWREEIKKVIEFGSPATAQLAKIKSLLAIKDI